MSAFRPLRFVGEPIEAGFDRAPALEKKPGCPDYFIWRGVKYRVVEKLSEWHDYRPRGHSQQRMIREKGRYWATAADRRGSWGVGRDYFRLRTEGGRIFELYYDRAPKDADRRKGEWFLVGELAAQQGAACGDHEGG